MPIDEKCPSYSRLPDDEIDQSTEDPVVEEEQEPSSSKPKKFLPKRRVVTERQQRDQLMELQKRTAKLIREQDNLRYSEYLWVL